MALNDRLNGMRIVHRADKEGTGILLKVVVHVYNGKYVMFL